MSDEERARHTDGHIVFTARRPGTDERLKDFRDYWVVPFGGEREGEWGTVTQVRCPKDCKVHPER